MSSNKLMKLVEKAGAVFDREGRGDHAIYRREVEGRVKKAPILEAKSDLPGAYCLIVFKQLGLSDEEINRLFE